MADTFRPRPAQEQILSYTGGYMGVSAVPGSGKTFTLSLLAAKLVQQLARTAAFDDREVLVVTFTNSAVENFRSRIARLLAEEGGLLPGVGYRVRTLHGLAHDIVRERPGLAGLSEDFDIVDERTAVEIRRDAVQKFLRTNPDALSPFIEPRYLQRSDSRFQNRLQQDADEIAVALIRQIKDDRLDLHRLRENLRRQSHTWPLLDFGLEVYADYQRSLEMRGAVDFDDLIMLALRVLEADPNYLERLQDRWPFVLEDEAQDSSALQEKLLRLLTAKHGNWVRVGDPNQAINTTFTSANTSFLRRFIAAHQDLARDLPNSGRSALPIVDAANRLIDWSQQEHPALPSDEALTQPYILPTPPGDPQPNPEPGDPPVIFYDRALSPEEEVDVVVKSLRKWLPQNPQRTVAVLAPDNNRIDRVAAALADADLPVDDSLLRTGSATRAAAKALAALLGYLAKPQTARSLADVWQDVWWPRKGERLAAQKFSDEAGAEVEATSPKPQRAHKAAGRTDVPEPITLFARALGQLRQPEDFLFPAQDDWLDGIAWTHEIEGFRDLIEAFRADVQRWTQATVLPVDELLLTLGNDLFAEPADLALAHFLAVRLAKLAEDNPRWRLPELARELDFIAQNRRRMLDFSEDAAGYAPKPGVTTLATMHGAKGLEWDRVYLLSVNNYSFPGGGDGDSYRGEPFYARDSLNLVAEAQAQLKLLDMGGGALDEYAPGEATRKARIDVAAERLRLLYVGMTRARQELIVLYNTGRNAERNPNTPAAAFEALAAHTAAA